MKSRQDVVTEARKWLGVAWRHMGRNENGIDCVGLVVVVARDLDLKHHDMTGYARQPSNLEMLSHFREDASQKVIELIKPGDIVIFRDGKFPFHVGIIGEKYDQLSVIHAYAGRKKVVEELYQPEWAKLTLACFEFPELEDV